ncbi:alpha/beta fold hydrolase [Microbacterium sp.]|uniref:alpha/beta fold hydrolase n=1 Tax=Microbacterium sp. TaxID=51671 RepID=UPI0039E36622
MAQRELVVFLHGLGTGPSSWASQLASLPPGFAGFVPPIAGLDAGDPTPFTLRRATARLLDELDARGAARVHLCGLSLGAMVATQLAIDHPERVASLVLSGGQVHPPRALMALQSVLLRVLPERIVAPDGTGKERVIAVSREIAGTDFRDRLAAITAPTLVLCGARDVANLRGARALAAGIPNARLHLVTGGGHELNTDKPAEFTGQLLAFLASVGPSLHGDEGGDHPIGP